MMAACSSDQMPDVKKLLRSVLLPNKNGLLLQSLQDEYVGMTGNIIPLRQLGYNTLLQLLQSMPDLANVEMLPDGNILVR